MRLSILVALAVALFTFSSGANSIWPRPLIVPLPETVTGVAAPVISLNGTWKLSANPPANYWQNSVDPASWSSYQVPSEAGNDNQAVKRQIAIPADFAGKRIFLRFDGVYWTSRIWVNGTLARAHKGGFTTFYCDITSLVTPGQNAWVTLEIIDDGGGISDESRYANHNLSGITRDASLVAIPANFISSLHVTTDFDANYTNATLAVNAAVSFNGGSAATVRLELLNAQGAAVALSPNEINLNSSAAEASISIPVTNPVKWDAEHPNLYTLRASLIVGGTTAEVVTRKIGFRKIVAQGNKLYVNGMEIKLRGTCRHSVDALRGRSLLRIHDSLDVVLCKEANMNFFRTSHYPVRESFLELCDRYGMYVEEENAVCFQKSSAVNDPSNTAEYLDQFSEMIERDKSHPSIIIWSLGNESEWGANINTELNYVRMEDPTRRVAFTYEAYGATKTDFYIQHYPQLDTTQWDAMQFEPNRPSFAEEFGIIPSSFYPGTALLLDPGVNDMWDKSIKMFWEDMMTRPGYLGGSIWALIDEYFVFPLGSTGAGTWGSLDAWRRPKPEHYLIKKAYSPVRIKDSTIANPGAGSALVIPVKNWFNHSNLNELSVAWSVGADHGSMAGPSVAPKAQGTLIIPARAWKDGDEVRITWTAADGRIVDDYSIPVGKRPVRTFPAMTGPAPVITENSSNITVAGSGFSVEFSKTTGLIARGIYGLSTVITGGPYLSWGDDSTRWTKTAISASTVGPQAVVDITGNADSTGIHYVVKIDGKGLITTGYTLIRPRSQPLEVGLCYSLSPQVDRFSFDRNSLWSVYPDDHIGRRTGTANRFRASGTETYGVAPTWPWFQDIYDFSNFGIDGKATRGTADFRSSKRNIYWATAMLAGGTTGLRAESDGRHSVRAWISNDIVQFCVLSNIGNKDISWGNWEPLFTLNSPCTDSVSVRLVMDDPLDIANNAHRTVLPRARMPLAQIGVGRAGLTIDVAGMGAHTTGIYRLDGRQVFSRRGWGSAHYGVRLDRGMYVIRIATGAGTITKTAVIGSIGD
jgi:hypothetical protein